MLRFNCQGLLNGVTAPKSIPDNGMANSGKARPFANAKALALKLQKNIGANVRLLNGWFGPSAIIRLIALGAVNAINRASNWALAHVGKKVFKSSPSFTDGYPGAAVHRELWVFWIPASGAHVRPRVIGLTCASMGCMAVFGLLRRYAARLRTIFSFMGDGWIRVKFKHRSTPSAFSSFNHKSPMLFGCQTKQVKVYHVRS